MMVGSAGSAGSAEEAGQKPARYVQDGKVYYRASALGMCDRLFVALANDYTPMEHPAWFLEVLQEGTDSEASIIGMYEAENPGVTIISQQAEVTLEVMEDVYVVGHIDGMTTANQLAEVKKFRESTWSKFLRSGVECQANYPMQVSAYMHALELEECEFIGGKYVDGEIVEIYTHHLTTPPVPLLGIRKRVAKLEALINGNTNVMDVACKVTYPCPMFYLHDSKEEDAPGRVERAPDDVIAPLVRELEALERAIEADRPRIKALQDRRRALQAGVHGWLEAMNVQDGETAIIKIGDNQWEAKYATVPRAGYTVQPSESVKVALKLVNPLVTPATTTSPASRKSRVQKAPSTAAPQTPDESSTNSSAPSGVTRTLPPRPQL